MARRRIGLGTRGAVDWGLVRSLAGMLALLLGVTGVTLHWVLVRQQPFPAASWLWGMSVILGTLGIASACYDFALIAMDRTVR